MTTMAYEISRIAGKLETDLSTTSGWKAVLAELERLYHETFNGQCSEDEYNLYRLMALVKLRIGLCLVDEGHLIEAIESYKQVWVQIGAFDLSSVEDREFVRQFGIAASNVGSRLVPPHSCLIDHAIAGRIAFGMANGAFQLVDEMRYDTTDIKDHGA